MAQIVAYTCDNCEDGRELSDGHPIEHMIVVAKGRDALGADPRTEMAKWQHFHTFCQMFCLRQYFENGHP